MKTITTTFGDNSVTAYKMNPVEASLLSMDLMAIVAPSIASVVDAAQTGNDEHLLTCFATLIFQNADAEERKRIQETLLMTLQGVAGEQVQSMDEVNMLLLAHQLNSFDVMIWLIKENVVDLITHSEMFKVFLPFLGKFKEALVPDDEEVSLDNEK